MNEWVSDQLNICKGVVALREKYPAAAVAKPVVAEDVVEALEQFDECVRYLNNRRSKGAVIRVESEDDVQDVVYLMLRPFVRDLNWESPGEKVASRFVIKDFVSREGRVVIEAKYVRDDKHGKDISREMHDDIEMYRHYPWADVVVFFVYDPDGFIPSVTELRRHIEDDRHYGRDGRVMRTKLIVKP